MTLKTTKRKRWPPWKPVGNSGVNICNHAVTIRTLTHVFGRSLVVSLKMQNLARVVIAGVVWAQQFPSQTGFEILDGSWRNHGRPPAGCDCGLGRDLTDRPLSDHP